MRAHVLSFHYYRLCLVVLFSEIRLCLRLLDGDENRKQYPTYTNVGLSFTELTCLWCVKLVNFHLQYVGFHTIWRTCCRIAIFSILTCNLMSFLKKKINKKLIKKIDSWKVIFVRTNFISFHLIRRIWALVLVCWFVVQLEYFTEITYQDLGLNACTTAPSC